MTATALTKRIPSTCSTTSTTVTVKKVDRERSPREAIRAIGCNSACIGEVVEAMPRGEGESVELVLFWFGLDIQLTNDDLAENYERLRLKPADPYSLLAFNEAEKAYGAHWGNMGNATHWKDAQFGWCHAKFTVSDPRRHTSLVTVDTSMVMADHTKRSREFLWDLSKWRFVGIAS